MYDYIYVLMHASTTESSPNPNTVSQFLDPISEFIAFELFVF